MHYRYTQKENEYIVNVFNEGMKYKAIAKTLLLLFDHPITASGVHAKIKSLGLSRMPRNTREMIERIMFLKQHRTLPYAKIAKIVEKTEMAVKLIVFREKKRLSKKAEATKKINQPALCPFCNNKCLHITKTIHFGSGLEMSFCCNKCNGKFVVKAF